MICQIICFARLSISYPLIILAENEEDMNSWMLTLQAAKYKVSTSQSRLSSSVMTDNEDSSESLISDVNEKDQEAVDDDDDLNDEVEGDNNNENLVTKKLPKDKDFENFKYQDVVMERRNSELHIFLKSVPEDDHVFHGTLNFFTELETNFIVFSCALQKEIAVQGRIYLTQSRICFYSSILGFVTVVTMKFQLIYH